MTAPTYLVQYGLSAHIGNFRAPTAGRFVRADRVVIRSPRGVEFGTILCEPNRPFGTATDGDLLRSISDDDESNWMLLQQESQAILGAANEAVNDQPVQFLDIEPLFDGRTFLLHALPWGDVDVTRILERLSAQLDRTLLVHDLSQLQSPTEEPEPSGCGKPGCGTESGGCSSCSTGGGCGTSSCSSGKVKSAAELTGFFKQLRTQMETDAKRTPLLG